MSLGRAFPASSQPGSGTAIRKGVDDGPPDKGPPDWEAIEALYRAGSLSIREIAKRHGVSDTAIRKKAKADGWERDLTAKVRDKVRTALVRTEVRTDGDANSEKRTEREIVEDAAAASIRLIREHRADIRDLRELATKLAAQLHDAVGVRDALKDLIVEYSEPGPRRAAMLKAVALPTHIAAARDLSNVLKNVVPLERQAFNIDAGGPEDPPADGNATPVEPTSLDAFLARLNEITGFVPENATAAGPEAQPNP